MKIKNDILKVISIMWYTVKLYVKSIFAFWGIMFLLVIKVHKNPLVEFQKISGATFYDISVKCAFVITIVLLAAKFALWLNAPDKDSGVTVEIITIDKSSLGIAKEENWNEKKRRSYSGVY